MKKYACPNCYEDVTLNENDITLCPNCKKPVELYRGEVTGYVNESAIKKNLELYIQQEHRAFMKWAHKIENLREDLISAANAKITPMYAANLANLLRTFTANYSEYEKAYYTRETLKSLLNE